MTTFELPVNLLRAAAQCMSNEETRYYLNGIALIPRDGKMWLVSTDGHVAFFAPTKTQSSALSGRGEFETVLPRTLIASALKWFRPSFDGTVSLTLDGQTATLADDGRSLSEPLIAGTFPDAWRVIPTTVEAWAGPAQFNPAMLLRVSEALRLVVGGKKGVFVPTVTHNGSGAAIVTSDTAQAFCLLMPIRVKDGALLETLRSLGVQVVVELEKPEPNRAAA